MKARTTLLLFFFIFTSSVLKSQSTKENVQFIGLHFGSKQMAEALSKEDFPDFSFYYSTSEAYSYYEPVKMLKNPEFLKGKYGEVPEKLGFTANYVEEKNKLNPFPYGSLYVIDKEGVIAYQIDNGESHYQPNSQDMDTESAIWDQVRKNVKNLAKGKLAKKSKKQEYLKKSPVGELEAFRGAKIDKKQEGIEGFEVPYIMLENNENKLVSLKDLCKGKVTVLVVFSLNGYKQKVVDREGTLRVYEPQMLLSPREYSKQSQANSETTKKAGDVLAEAGKELIGTHMQNNSSPGQLTKKQRLELYHNHTALLGLMQKFAETLN